jgi:hypothetical protein
MIIQPVVARDLEQAADDYALTSTAPRKVANAGTILVGGRAACRGDSDLRISRALSAATARLAHVDPDRLRHDRGIVWHMIFVPEQELKRMPPW